MDSFGKVINFQKEITNMMHGLGDNPNPNAATVVLIESIVRKQLRWMLQEALNHANGKAISNYHIIYLLRENKFKMKRLHDYELKLDEIEKSRLVVAPESILLENILKEEPAVKIHRSHIDIIQEFDELCEVSQMKFDSIDYLRKGRAAKITESMALDKYEAYHKARCSSFRTGYGPGKGFVKLEKWLNPHKYIKISVSALEVLCFLAYETVAEIVDAVFLIRQDACEMSGYEDIPAITVAEVNEVSRRYFNPTVGMNELFYRSINLELLK